MSADPKWLTPRNKTQIAGLWVMLGSAFAASAVNGFYGRIELGTAIAIGAACGVVGGALYATGRASIAIGAICGLMCALGGLAAAYYWTRGRDRLHSDELALAWFVGALPGAFIFKAWAQARADEVVHSGDVPPTQTT